MKNKGFNFKECFPEIEKSILRLGRSKKDWVTRAEIVHDLLENSEISRQPDIAGAYNNDVKRAIIGKMVDFLNMRITQYERKSDFLPDGWDKDFVRKLIPLIERKKIANYWAFKVIS